MPSLRKAYDLWLYDRPLFWQRLKANLNRGTHSPLSFLRGNASLQQDILLASPLCTERRAALWSLAATFAAQRRGDGRPYPVPAVAGHGVCP